MSSHYRESRQSSNNRLHMKEMKEMRERELLLKNDIYQKNFEIKCLEKKVEQLSLNLQGMWELMKQNGGYTEDQLQEKVREIDLRDGIMDGALEKPARKCASCNRTVSINTNRCIYCGLQAQPEEAFG